MLHCVALLLSLVVFYHCPDKPGIRISLDSSCVVFRSMDDSLFMVS